MKEKIKNKEIERLNLIPILDAIFIFIFFLLLSTEFVHLGEIAIKLDQLKKEKGQNNYKVKDRIVLNLFLGKDRVTLKAFFNGKEQRNVYKIDNKLIYLKKLRKKLILIKGKMSGERRIKVWPGDEVSYQDVLRLIENIKFYYKGSKKIELFRHVTLGNLGGGYP